MKHSAITNRRLNDGQEALAAKVPKTKNLQELIDYRNQLHDGIAALQSLDDLGSEEANNAAWGDMLALQRRYDKVSKCINKFKKYV